MHDKAVLLEHAPVELVERLPEALLQRAVRERILPLTWQVGDQFAIVVAGRLTDIQIAGAHFSDAKAAVGGVAREQFTHELVDFAACRIDLRHLLARRQQEVVDAHTREQAANRL